MSNRSSTIVFDFDLTLTRWDTADRFFRWLLRRDLWRLAVIACLAPVLSPLFVLRATRKLPIRFAIWLATLGRSNDDLQRLIQEHIATLAHKTFIPTALSQLRTHLDQDHCVVIATGCLAPLAAALLHRAGFGHVPLVASTHRHFLGGIVVDRHCFGHNKVSMLQERGFSPPWAAAYTDHRADLPILRLSNACFLVSPRPRCLAIIRQALPVQPTVLAWRQSYA
ncbi:MAG: haloacid dehalogenase-like hydrolase [Rhodanobacteraceae bacterium]|nr:haloacid dehalogenase-like hydrolase [Rhodanobacteraceae bacterium]